MSSKINIIADIEKLDEEQQVVYGWASVIQEGSDIVIDKQGDVIEEQVLVDAVHKFMSESRIGKEMHSGERKGEIVESMVFTKAVQDSLGIDLGKIGWFVGYKVHDTDLWKAVKSGKYRAFSIGGRAAQETIDV